MALQLLPPAEVLTDAVIEEPLRKCLLAAVADRAAEAPDRTLKPLVAYAS